MNELFIGIILDCILYCKFSTFRHSYSVRFKFLNCFTKVELDVDKSVGYPVRAELGRRTGRTSVPSIWIGGQFIGGCNDGPVVTAGDGRVQVYFMYFELLIVLNIIYLQCYLLLNFFFYDFYDSNRNRVA